MNLERVRAALDVGRPALGTHCFCEDIGFYEMCGMLGYDYVWIDNEHAGLTDITIRNGIVGANASGCAAFVRVRCNDPALAKPVLEMGPDGIIFPMVNTAEEAERAVKSCLYPPKGTRGFGPIRAMKYNTLPEVDLDDYVEQANRSVLKIIQIEHETAVKNLDEILEVPGIDLVICGPMDLSASVGKIGRFSDPEVSGLMNSIIDKCKDHGVNYGLSIGYGMDLVKYWLDRGANFVSMGNPYDYFNMMSRNTLTELHHHLESK